MKTRGTVEATDGIVAPTGTYAISLTISGVPVATGTGSDYLVSVSGHLQNEIDAVDRRLIATTVLDAPSDEENFTVMKVADDITLEKMFAVLRGPGFPSVTWTVKHDTDRSAAGTAVVTAGTTTTSTTTGDVITAMNNPTIPVNSWVWLETTVTGGSPQELSVELFA